MEPPHKFIRDKDRVKVHVASLAKHKTVAVVHISLRRVFTGKYF